MMTTPDDDNPYVYEQPEIEYELVSKSEMKREMHRWQAMGQQLCGLPVGQWDALPISETLLAALQEYRRLKQGEAIRRHLQYIGKLMRNEDVDAIREAIELQDPSSEAYGRRQKQQEQWRARLLDDDQAMNEFIDAYPDVDRQHLRTLIRNAKKEQAAESAKNTHFKKLFQVIKECMS